MDSEIKSPKRRNPRESANLISALIYLDVIPIFIRSYTKGFTEEDLFEPLQEHKSSMLGDNLEKTWLEENRKNNKSAFLKSLTKMFGLGIVLIGILKLATELGYVIIVPYMVGGLVTYFGDDASKVTDQDARIYGGLLIGTYFVYYIICHACLMVMQHYGMKIRVACCSLIYRKSLKLNHTSLAQTTIGQIVNIFTNDVSKFDYGFVVLHYFWTSPIQTAVGTYLLYRSVGVAAFAGIAFLLLFVPLQIYLAKRNALIRLKIATRTDERVRVMAETLSGIQAIKMYAWEKPFSKLVSKVRRLEVKGIRHRYYVQAFMRSLEMFSTRTSLFITIVVYIYLGNSLSGDTVYTITATYNILRPFITQVFSSSILALGEMLVTIKRLQNFMTLEELTARVSSSETQSGEETALLPKPDTELNTVSNTSKIFLKSVCAKWCNASPENTLSDLNLNIESNQLVAIIGPVGSGKSSIMNIILRELPIISGYLETKGTISYASQDPWLFSASLRQNILFGASYDKERYKAVLKICALGVDIKSLPYGDKTIVGEKGSGLSGGQKARINLARCIYKQADIYLLDDPLSAVDAKVGKILYHDCITRFLGDKIRVLVTHQIQYLKNADKIIIINKGKIVTEGSYKELLETGLDFSTFLQVVSNRTGEELRNETKMTREDSELLLEHYEEPDDVNNKEKLEIGDIPISTYFGYYRAGGNYLVMALLVLAFVAAQSVAVGGDYFVACWVNMEQKVIDYNTSVDKHNGFTPIFDRSKIIYTYSGIIVATIILAIMHMVFFFTFLTRASANLHDIIFSKISYATMRFFNNNPTGRILNRFSKDMGIIDDTLPMILFDTVHAVLVILGIMIVTSITNQWLLIPSAGLLAICYFLRLVYLKTSRSVKRIEGISRSPVLNHINATLDGLSTVRAFEAQNILVTDYDSHQDLHSSAWFLYLVLSRGFGFWVDIIYAICFSFLVASILLIDKDYYNGGDIGLILTQYLTVANVLQWGVRQWTELENNMVSVERVLEYTKVDTEPVRDLVQHLPSNWPAAGEIILKDVTLKYSPSEPAVLKLLNFTINPGEKVGIVGRTGAGKSSTISVLFQLYEIEGTIIIDGVDTTKLPLNIIRTKLSIIPQAPVLFSGTIRKNLDPFEEFNDDTLWSALEDVELKDVIMRTNIGLSAHVSESGSNFSIGQRQLVCLARAIIRKSKILLMDEATANVDLYTDSLIQKTIRRKFSESTVITIAHRLETVMDSDRILVMDGGCLVAFDHPYNLLQQSDSIFYSIVQATGAATSESLRTIAEEKYKKTM